MRNFKAMIAAGAACLFVTAAWADTVKLTATLEPDPQGQVKSGKGTATLSLDTSSKTLTGTIEYSGLSKPPEMAAFLSPPPSQNAQPGTLPIPLPAKAASPINVKMQLQDSAITGLKSGDWMLLIGTKQAPELGGDVKPAQ
ncbi:MAG TPA: CHRD domain-containing protein [Stellaceae bacterium]|nr:CHRD domain-containing protein [Stellaceae bacterium]